MSNAIPESVTHDDFLTAIKPLLDLLGVTDKEIYTDLHIVGSSAPDEVCRVTTNVVARGSGDGSDFPAGVHLAEAPQDNAELAWPVTVKVVIR